MKDQPTKKPAKKIYKVGQLVLVRCVTATASASVADATVIRIISGSTVSTERTTTAWRLMVVLYVQVCFKVRVF